MNEELARANERIKELEARLKELGDECENERERANENERELIKYKGLCKQLEEQVEQLEDKLENEKSQRGTETQMMRKEIEALKRQINELLAGDPYMVWMEGRVEQLLHENDVLTDHRDTYLKNRRLVAPEMVGELCVRCATQVLAPDKL